MDSQFQYRALVVDDEPMVRQGVMRALSRTGFRCEAAPNGCVALDMAKQGRYDVVVTDLRMPESNGHQLAIDLLAMPKQPAIVVLTGVMEPKLAADLRTRGVDEILFKPVEFELLATTVRRIVDQRARIEPANREAIEISTRAEAEAAAAEKAGIPNAADDLGPRLAKAAGKLRNPPNDFDGFSKASASGLCAKELANAIELDPSVATDILGLANRFMYSSHHKLLELQRSAAEFQQNAIVGAVIIFIVGALVGWLLSWFGTGNGVYR